MYQENSIEVSSLNLFDGPTRKLSRPVSEDISIDNDSHLATDSTSTAARLRYLNARWYLRLLLVIAAVLIGLFLSGIVYYASRKGEVDEFESESEELLGKLVDTLEAGIARKLTALDSLSISLTSATIEHGEHWPTTGLPHFDLRAKSTMMATKSHSILYAPLVHQEDHSSWEEYLEANTEWARESDGTAANNGTDYGIHVFQHLPYSTQMVNFDLTTSLSSSKSMLALLSDHDVILGSIFQANAENDNDRVKAFLSTIAGEQGMSDLDSLVSMIFYPVNDSFKQSSHLAGVYATEIFWKDFFSQLVPIGHNDEVICVLRNQCGQVYTFHIREDKVTSVREGDFHDPAYDSLEQALSFDSLGRTGGLQAGVGEFCLYSIHLYPSSALENEYVTFKPAIYAASTAFGLLVLFIVSLAYERRVAHINANATQYRDVISDLYPAVVRNRMFGKEKQDPKTGRGSINMGRNRIPIIGRQTTPSPTETQTVEDHIIDIDDLTAISKPIADHFPSTTVLFADIAGFTGWSAKRNPEQVFTLLQTLFNAFDGIAKKRKVFKVETIGDCYMAVTGVPDPQPDHALRMTKFARECLFRISGLLSRLETTLGEGTSDLTLRFGLHSGPVTAGVLQGEKSRFQLFGDTVNTASRMESNGEKGRIHLSKTTADLLVEAQKDHWLEKRDDPIHAKGKGLMETYWIVKRNRSLKKHRDSLIFSSEDSESDKYSDSEQLGSSLTSLMSWASDTSENASTTETRSTNDLWSSAPVGDADLVNWQVDIFRVYLARIVARRDQLGVTGGPMQDPGGAIPRGSCAIDEFSTRLPLPTPAGKVMQAEDLKGIVLLEKVTQQLRDFISTISRSYSRTAFHSFARATHTTLIMHKFLEEITVQGNHMHEKDCLGLLAADPLMQFTLIFAALIHDVDHPGVPNDVFAREQPDIAMVYNGCSVTEQHSLEIAWELLMDSGYTDLQHCIFSNKEELLRFRQILVNLVLSTDLPDDEMQGVRLMRWEQAFSQMNGIISGRDSIQLRFSVVVELLLQVADFSHTMQEWNVYTRWSKKKFQEDLDAYRTGRLEVDPMKVWYAQEVAMFDNHAIPLVEKLSKITGWSHLLSNVKSNRQHWILHGRQQVKDFGSDLILLHRPNTVSLDHESSNSSYRFTLEGEGL